MLYRIVYESTPVAIFRRQDTISGLLVLFLDTVSQFNPSARLDLLLVNFQRNFEEHLRNVLRFHATLGEHVQWLDSMEIALTGFPHPSKIVNKVEQQIAKHKVNTTAVYFVRTTRSAYLIITLLTEFYVFAFFVIQKKKKSEYLI